MCWNVSPCRTFCLLFVAARSLIWLDVTESITSAYSPRTTPYRQTVALVWRQSVPPANSPTTLHILNGFCPILSQSLRTVSPSPVRFTLPSPVSFSPPPPPPALPLLYPGKLQHPSVSLSVYPLCQCRRVGDVPSVIHRLSRLEPGISHFTVPLRRGDRKQTPRRKLPATHACRCLSPYICSAGFAGQRFCKSNRRIGDKAIRAAAAAAAVFLRQRSGSGSHPL
jgi:hypothetical protein